MLPRLLAWISNRERFAGLVLLVATAILGPWLGRCAIGYVIDQTLYFDSANYQFMAWDLRHGGRLYESVATVDGPFPTFLFAIAQSVIGEGDEAMRCFDLVFHVVLASVMGVVVAPGRTTSRIGYALGFVAIWLATYFTYTWENTVQREATYSALGYLGMLLAWRASESSGRLARRYALIACALTGAIVFGKLTLGVFAALVVVLLRWPGTHRVRPRVLVTGFGLVTLAFVLGMAGWGSFHGYVFWALRTASFHPHLLGDFPSAWRLLVHAPVSSALITVGILVVGIAASITGAMPRRLIVFAVVPALLLATVALQRKGYPYQYQPIHFGACVFAALVLRTIELRYRAESTRGRALLFVVPVVVGVASGIVLLRRSPWYELQLHREQSTGRADWTPSDYASYSKVAGWLRAASQPNDPIFTYGYSSPLLVRAARHHAGPSFIPHFLNPRAAVHFALTEADEKQLQALERDIARLNCPAILDSKVTAMALCDGAEAAGGNAIEAVTAVCPAFRETLLDSFAPAGQSGCWRVWVRDSKIADEHWSSLASDYVIGDRIAIGGEDDARWMGLGWSWPEGSFRWSDGPISTVTFHVPNQEPTNEPLFLTLEMFGSVSPRRPQFQARIVLNDVPLGSVTFTNGDPIQATFAIPSGALQRRGTAEIRILPSDTRSPLELGVAQDPRQLAVGLRSFRLFRR
jgi:hypothetical protein